MRSAVQYLGRSLSVEVLKCRRTLVFWLAAGAPFFMVFLAFNITLFQGEGFIKQGDNPWGTSCTSSGNCGGSSFSRCTLPCNRCCCWPSSTRPTPGSTSTRWPCRAGRCTSANSCSAWAWCASAWRCSTCSRNWAGLLLALLRPELGFGKYSISLLLLRGYSKLVLAGLGIVAIQHVLSTRYPNFLIPAAFGFAMTTAGIAVGGQQVIEYLPYSFPALALKDDTMTYVPLFNRPVYLSLAVFVGVSLLGYRAIARRDVN
jgi:hypothetical protein